MCEIVEVAIDKDIIKRGGAWYYMDKGTPAEQKFQGKQAILDLLNSDLNMFNKIKADVEASYAPDVVETKDEDGYGE